MTTAASLFNARPGIGITISSSSSSGADPVAEARHAEALGFDMVSVHRDVLHGPPPSLETWTLLTWLAAHTTTVKLAPNVLALPNRHPAVLAKMAETLDRLAGGRLILALGGGAPINHQAFGAFGLARRSPDETVAATEEAIDVIRGLSHRRPNHPVSLTRAARRAAISYAVCSGSSGPPERRTRTQETTRRRICSLLCGPGVGGGGREVVRRDVVSEVAGLCDVDQQVCSGGRECLGGGQTRCPDRWVQAGQRADDQGGCDAAAHNPGGHHGRPALQASVYCGDRGTEQHSGASAERGQQQRLRQELDPDLPTRGAQRAAQPDFGAALEHGDHHGVGYPDPADQQGDGAQAEQEPGEGDVGGGLGGERVQGGDTSTSLGWAGLAVAASTPRTVSTMSGWVRV
jgi:hypothetical protein